MEEYERIIHDVSWAAAHAFLDPLAHLYREEEQRELFALFYNGTRGAIQAYCIQLQRMRQRIAPSKN